MILYKRNAQGKPIFWEINNLGDAIGVRYGLVGKEGRTESFNTHRKIEDEINSLIKAKRKEGYKALEDLYDNAPIMLDSHIYHYLNSYLPKFNTHEDRRFIPMLCKTLEDNKPFEKGNYFGQWKINGERCIIGAEKGSDLFGEILLTYRSREGVDWTYKLNYLDNYLIPIIRSNGDDLLELMLEEGVCLDGELYLPGYGINEINSFIKNTELPQHYQLQFWCYDLCVENMSAVARQVQLGTSFGQHRIFMTKKEEHLNNKERFIYLPSYPIIDIVDATFKRDLFIDLGFEGLVIREESAEYQFGGRRNNSMLKFKKKEDGLFEIADIIPEGKRTHLPKFVLYNDINEQLFECTLNAPHKEQEAILVNKDNYIGGKYRALVEFRERSGISQVPFHAKIVKLIKQNES